MSESRGGSANGDERPIERVLEWLDAGGPPETGPEGPGERPYVELLGLLAERLEPVEPWPEIRQRLLDAVTAGGAGEPPASAATAREAAPPAVPEVADLAARSAASAAAAPARPRSAAGRWALPLAAGLAAALLGLSAWLYGEVRSQRLQIAELAGRLAAVEEESRFAVAAMDRKMRLLTSPGVEVCNLTPVGEEPVHPSSRGTLYVAADHREWYLKIDGLEPCPEGRHYQLWFVTGDGPVSGGVFEVRAGVRFEMLSREMPEATRAVRVTLEPAGGSPVPSGPEVLYGDEVMRIL